MPRMDKSRKGHTRTAAAELTKTFNICRPKETAAPIAYPPRLFNSLSLWLWNNRCRRRVPLDHGHRMMISTARLHPSRFSGRGLVSSPDLGRSRECGAFGSRKVEGKSSPAATDPHSARPHRFSCSPGSKCHHRQPLEYGATLTAHSVGNLTPSHAFVSQNCATTRQRSLLSECQHSMASIRTLRCN